jgi:hypothetical protein
MFVHLGGEGTQSMQRDIRLLAWSALNTSDVVTRQRSKIAKSPLRQSNSQPCGAKVHCEISLKLKVVSRGRFSCSLCSRGHISGLSPHWCEDSIAYGIVALQWQQIADALGEHSCCSPAVDKMKLSTAQSSNSLSFIN